jgi:hypothetical protein
MYKRASNNAQRSLVGGWSKYSLRERIGSGAPQTKGAPGHPRPFAPPTSKKKRQKVKAKLLKSVHPANKSKPRMRGTVIEKIVRNVEGERSRERRVVVWRQKK